MPEMQKMFQGTDLKSMELNKTGVARAVFRFHMLRSCCVSEDVFLDVAAQKFINDATEFLLQLKHGNVLDAN
jgi:hypothetical protein